jgi:glycosyltransferase involved in cell wall biosynthesis
MKISVIIPAYNEEKDIINCLNSLKKQSCKNFEIIVVDDGSTDKTLDVIKKFKNVKIIKQNHKGPGSARNLGAKKAKGEILVFIDADMSFNKNYINNLVRPIIRDKKIIGTTHDYEIATNTDNIWSALWGKIRVSKEKAKEIKIFRAIRKDKFLELGGFDSKYGYADDQTFWYKYGIKPVVAENTLCYHKNPSTLKGTYHQARWIGASWKERYKMFKLPAINYFLVLLTIFIIPIWIAIKTIKKTKKGITIYDKLRFYSYKFFGYYLGLLKAVFLGKVWK